MKYKTYRFLIMTFLSIGLFTQIGFGNINYTEMDITIDGNTQRYKAKEVKMLIDGKDITGLTMPPIILNDYTLVPAREVFEQLGAVVGWNGNTSEVYIAYEDDLVVLKINETSAILNDSAIMMEIPPKIINNKTMIPVRFVSEALGFEVNWNGETGTVYINSPIIVTDGEKGDTDTIIEEPDSNEGNGKLEDTEVGTVDEDLILATDISGKISEENHTETSIISIDTGSNIKIHASSPISKVDKFILKDNRLIIDIYNSKMDLSQTEYTPTVKSAVSKIRAAQNQIEPEKITRIVLELQSGITYGVNLSPDRKTISVDFEKNQIHNVSFSSDGNSDYITISGNRKPIPDIMTLSDPKRLVLDFPYTDINEIVQNVSGRFVNSMRVAMFEGTTARVVLDINQNVKYSYTEEGNSIRVKIEEPSYRNIYYDNSSKIITLKKDPNNPININNIRTVDDYFNYKYTIVLPGNYQNQYGYGEYDIKDENLSSINIETGSETHIVLKERKIFETRITEDYENIYIELKAPKEVYDKIIVIDPGHGGYDPGTSGQGHQEKVLTQDIAIRLMALLNQNQSMTGIKAYSTRSGDEYISRFDRGPLANAIGGDLFMSIHLNSAHPNTVPNGTETYYHPHSDDSTIGLSSYDFAVIVQKNLLNDLNSFDRKVKKNTYTVLLETNMPAVLCEIGFLSNPEEGGLLGTPEYRQKVAESLYRSIIETFNIYTPKR